MADEKHIYLVRHGRSTANETGIRHADDHLTPLTEEGVRQAQSVAERFRTIPIDLVMTSHYERARDTGKAIADVSNVPLEVIEAAHERIFPRSVAGMHRDDPDALAIYAKFDKAWHAGAPTKDGESFHDVLERVKVTTQILEEREEKRIALATHGLFTKLFVAHHLLGDYLTPELFVNTILFGMKSQNTGITYFKVNAENTWQLCAWNDYAHLGDT